MQFKNVKADIHGKRKKGQKEKTKGEKGGNVIGQSRIGKRNRLATATTLRKTINNINKK